MANKHFPHLDRMNDYPYLDTVDVFRFQNEFDYTRWNENSRIKLVNVIWNGDYKDVVKFDTDEARDAYFDSLKGQEITLLSKNTRMFPDGSVKLPIPYDVLARYNYLFVDMPLVTSSDAPIDYERENGIRRWYFFIDSLTYQSPNTTTAYLSPDVWTNFINNVEINYMMLERGHAPVAFSNVDEYLSNPIENNRYLLAPDYDFNGNTIVANSDYIPFGNGEKWVCFASTCKPEQLSDAGTVAATSEKWSKPTYSDVDARYGYQLKVNGFEFGDGRNFGNVTTPVSNGSTNNGFLFNNTTIYAVPASVCFDNYFLDNMMQKAPGFMNTILACFIVDESMATFEVVSNDFLKYTLYVCKGKNEHLKDIKLTRESFDFPEKYANFAKLYTFPYSSLELTDNDGKVIEVRIEDTSTIGCNVISSVAFPFLDLRVFFTGIGGVGSTRYSWVKLNGEIVEKEMWDSDWFKYCFDMNIPTYALYMDGATSYNLHNYNRSISNARRSALVGYHNSVREANTARENAVDLADTARSNVNANANTMVTNNTNTCNTNSANTAITCSTNSSNQSLANQAASSIVYNNNSTDTACTRNSNSLMRGNTAAENEASIATTANIGANNVNVAGINGVMSGGMMGANAGPGGIAAGAILGGIMGSATAQMTANTNNDNALILTQTQATLVGDTVGRNNQNLALTTANNNDNTTITNNLGTDQTANNNACITSQTANNNACATTNTSNTSNTMKANATRTRDTSVDNATYTQEVAILNAKEVLENSQYQAQAAYNDARNNAPIQYGSDTGSHAPDYMATRGVQVKVRRQSDSAISQVGDMFARYGYTLNQVWDICRTGLNLMKHFTYWKASDIWVNDKECSTNAVNDVISGIFLNGVTVWNDPDEIGRVSVYAN